MNSLIAPSPELNIFATIVGSIVLVVSLQWNGFFSQLIQDIYPDNSKTLFAKFAYTVVITVGAGYFIKYFLAIKDVIPL